VSLKGPHSYTPDRTVPYHTVPYVDGLNGLTGCSFDPSPLDIPVQLRTIPHRAKNTGVPPQNSSVPYVTVLYSIVLRIAAMHRTAPHRAENTSEAPPGTSSVPYATVPYRPVPRREHQCRRRAASESRVPYATVPCAEGVNGVVLPQSYSKSLLESTSSLPPPKRNVGRRAECESPPPPHHPTPIWCPRTRNGPDNRRCLLDRRCLWTGDAFWTGDVSADNPRR